MKRTRLIGTLSTTMRQILVITDIGDEFDIRHADNM
jgi:hypothetical protein